MHLRFLLVITFLALLIIMTLPGVAADWPQWRGINRDGRSLEVPLKLPAKQLLWRRALAGEAHGGIVVADGFVVLPDHGDGKDYLRCVKADSGEPVWTYTRDAAEELNYGPAPRATPLIAHGKVYALSAFGKLDCLNLQTGALIWQKDLVADFSATLPQWGYTASPLIAAGKLIINPGAPNAGLVALDPESGYQLWSTPGAPAAYASFIAGVFGGKAQVIGYDAESLGGWELATGKRLWTLKPDNGGDFNVGTPVNVNGKLLVATDNNKTRLYGFTATGLLIPKPLAVNAEFAPDMGTPVFSNGRIFGIAFALYCLDLSKGLKTAWRADQEEAFTGFATAIAGNNRVMLFTERGTLFLLAAERPTCTILDHLDLCGKTWSHPALANGKLYIRDEKWLYCYAMR